MREARAAVGIALLAVLLVAAGMVLLHQPSTGQALWGSAATTIGAVFPNGVNVVRGTVWILVGLAGFGWAVAQLQALTDEPVLEATPVGKRLHRHAPLAVLPAALFYLAAVVLLLLGSTSYRTGVLFVIGLILAALAVALVYTPPPLPVSRWEWAALTVAAILGFALYIHDAANWFFSWIGDEWAFFTYAEGIARGVDMNIFRQAGVYGTHPTMDSVYQAVTIRLFGDSAIGWRISCGLATALPVFPLYVLGRTVASRVAAATAVGLYVPAAVLLAYAHIGYNQPDGLFPLVGAVALAAAGTRLRAPFYLFTAGICAGLGWYTISTARVGIVLAVFAVLIGRMPFRQDLFRDLALLLAGFLLTLLPTLLVNGWFLFSVLGSQSRLNFPGTPPLGVLLSQNGLRSLYALVYSADVDNHYVVGALFDSVSALAWLLGTAALVVRRSRWAIFLLVSYWLLVALNGPTYYTLHLNSTRMYIVIPVACVIAGIGVEAVSRQLGVLAPTLPAGPALVVLTVAGAFVLNMYDFYRVVPETMPSSPSALEMRVLQSYPRATVVDTGALAQIPFRIAADAYGVGNRLIDAPAALTPVLKGIPRGQPVIVVSTTPPNGTVRGRQTLVWDPGMHTSIVAVFAR